MFDRDQTAEMLFYPDESDACCGWEAKRVHEPEMYWDMTGSCKQE